MERMCLEWMCTFIWKIYLKNVPIMPSYLGISLKISWHFQIMCKFKIGMKAGRSKPHFSLSLTISILTDLVSHSRHIGLISPSFHPWNQCKHSIPRTPWWCYGWWCLSVGQPWRKGQLAEWCHYRSVETNGLRLDLSLSTAKCSPRPLSLARLSPWSAQMRSPDLSGRENERGYLLRILSDVWIYKDIKHHSLVLH